MARSGDRKSASTVVPVGPAFVDRACGPAGQLSESCHRCGMVHIAQVRVALLARHVEQLTERERDVFARMAAGPSNEVLAGQLTVTERTVRAHLEQIRGKLGGISRQEVVVAALFWNAEKCRSRQ